VTLDAAGMPGAPELEAYSPPADTHGSKRAADKPAEDLKPAAEVKEARTEEKKE
jgi:hypothetical protein